MLTKFNLILAIAVMACCTEVNAQGCGCDAGYDYAPVTYGGYGGCGGGVNNCGRTISQGDAAALWADYCTETCPDNGGLFGRLKGNCGGGFGCGGGSCGCDLGCFGYPAGGGCGGGCFAGKFGGGRLGRGCGGCGLKGRHAGAVSCDSCSCDSCSCGEAPVMFSGGCDTCGCCGDDSYFSQPVGYEYGTAGIHSAVQGCATGACGGSFDGGDMGAAQQDAGAMGAAMEGAAASMEPGQIPLN